MSETQFYILLAAVGLMALGLAVHGLRQLRGGGKEEDSARALEKLERAMAAQFTAARGEQSDQGKNLREEVRGQISEAFQSQNRRLTDMQAASERQQETLRTKVDEKLTALSKENTKKLDEMRQTVDEKLQGALKKRLDESFNQVSERLEAVHRGLGEMQELANGVGDLKRVLTNVKTRGGWGEVQLEMLLSDTLAAEQYGKNVAVKPDSAERVEFAIKLPGRDGEDGAPVYLPVDSKFPHEAYERLLAAAAAADAQALEAAGKAFEADIKKSAKTISEKYVEPPHTTDFAIMYLPTEGLFAEAARRPGLINTLQNTHRIVVAGPTTFTALLNSLQMGFQTLKIEKSSSKISKTLAEVKTEFGKFGAALSAVKKKLREAGNHIELVERRTRVMGRVLKGADMDALPGAEAGAVAGENLLTLAAPGDEDEYEDADADEDEDADSGENPA